MDHEALKSKVASPVADNILSGGIRGDGKLTPEESRGVAKGQSSATTETGSGDNGAVGSSIAGSGGGGGGVEYESSSTPDRCSVLHDAPNIPNVVEYHLKVKPPGPRYHHKKRITETTTASTTDTRTNPSTDMRKDHQQSQTGRSCNIGSSLSEEQRRELTLRLAKLSIDREVLEGSSDLPQVFQVKYLGSHDARGLWGIKHTRKPVDSMVSAAKNLPSGTILPLVKLVISEDGVGLLPLQHRIRHPQDPSVVTRQQTESNLTRVYPIESISYGVQDLVYTRVFSMIVVRDTDDFRRRSPFECHGFVCESKHHARQITHALAAAFQIYSQHVKDCAPNTNGSGLSNDRKGYAIKLSNPNEFEADYTLNPDE
ncbi:hypothetical protein QAD02_015170 [Eretmocerus hayati]|uniref:Uncharacterized protein n=1 Tax=Eretmocerus hayati TaxID=131215 RepID=A0ACC2P8I1_9HYME|nr:hypothetical protein QAD02_015170 [Eretmocerus hayati]